VRGYSVRLWGCRGRSETTVEEVVLSAAVASAMLTLGNVRWGDHPGASGIEPGVSAPREAVAARDGRNNRRERHIYLVRLET
jgi:hypothetical protein